MKARNAAIATGKKDGNDVPFYLKLGEKPENLRPHLAYTSSFFGPPSQFEASGTRVRKYEQVKGISRVRSRRNTTNPLVPLQEQETDAGEKIFMLKRKSVASERKLFS